MSTEELKKAEKSQDGATTTPAKAEIHEPSQRDLISQDLERKKTAILQLKAQAADHAFERDEARTKAEAHDEAWRSIIEQVKGLATEINATEAALQRLA